MKSNFIRNIGDDVTVAMATRYLQHLQAEATDTDTLFSMVCNKEVIKGGGVGEGLLSRRFCNGSCISQAYNTVKSVHSGLNDGMALQNITNQQKERKLLEDPNYNEVYHQFLKKLDGKERWVHGRASRH